MGTRKDRERATEELLEQQIVLAQFGELALRSDSLDGILTEACRLVGRALNTDLAKVLECREGQPLLVRAGVGWKEGVVGHVELGVDEGSPEGLALKTGEPMISSNVDDEKQFQIPDLLKEHGVKAVINVIIRGTGDKPPFGVLEVDSREPRRFTEDDIAFLRTYANVIAAAVERIRMMKALQATVDEKERLLLELQHRTKNSLQFITGLIQIQAHRSRSKEAQRALRALGDRIATLRLVYEKLYAAAETNRVDLGAYLGELSSSLIRFHAEGRKIRLRTDLQSVAVEPETAIALGMITNEFITNSLKYAFSGERGVIGIEVHEREPGQACLMLWDNGKGLPEKPANGGGTGLALIGGFVHQIGAEADWQSNGGTRLTINFIG